MIKLSSCNATPPCVSICKEKVVDLSIPKPVIPDPPPKTYTETVLIEMSGMFTKVCPANHDTTPVRFAKVYSATATSEVSRQDAVEMATALADSELNKQEFRELGQAYADREGVCTPVELPPVAVSHDHYENFTGTFVDSEYDRPTPVSGFISLRTSIEQQHPTVSGLDVFSFSRDGNEPFEGAGSFTDGSAEITTTGDGFITIGGYAGGFVTLWYQAHDTKNRLRASGMVRVELTRTLTG